MGSNTTMDPIDFHYMDKNRFFELFYFLIFTEGKKSYRFGMTCGSVNDDPFQMKHTYTDVTHQTTDISMTL